MRGTTLLISGAPTAFRACGTACVPAEQLVVLLDTRHKLFRGIDARLLLGCVDAGEQLG